MKVVVLLYTVSKSATRYSN